MVTKMSNLNKISAKKTSGITILFLILIENINHMVVLLFFISILMFTDTKIRLCDLFMLAGLTFLTFMSRRQESLFVLMCIPIFNRLITSFLNKYDPKGINQMKKMLLSVTVGHYLLMPNSLTW